MTILQLTQYETKEFQKAFLKGTDSAWRTYRRNVKKAVENYNKENGKENGYIDIDKFMS